MVSRFIGSTQRYNSINPEARVSIGGSLHNAGYDMLNYIGYIRNIKIDCWDE